MLEDEFKEVSNLFGLLLSSISWLYAELILNGYFISLMTLASCFSSTDAFLPEAYFPLNFFFVTSLESFFNCSSSKVSIMLLLKASTSNYFIYTLFNFGLFFLYSEGWIHYDWTSFENKPVDSTSLWHSFIWGEQYFVAELFLFRFFFNECYFLNSSHVFDLTNGCLVSFEIGFKWKPQSFPWFFWF